MDELNERLQRKNLEFQVIQTLSNEINTTLDIDAIFTLAMRNLDDNFGFRHSLILLKEPESEILKVAASHGYEGSGLGALVPMGQGVIGVVAKRQKIMRSTGLQYRMAYAQAVARAVDLEPAAMALPGLADVKSQLAIPLVVKGELIGVYAVESNVVNAFDEVDELILGIVGNQIGAALANARAYRTIRELTEHLEARVSKRTAEAEEARQEAERERRDAEVLADLSRQANASRDLDQILQAVGQLVQERFEADAMGFYIVESSASQLVLRASYRNGVLTDPALAAEILRTIPLQNNKSITLARTLQKKTPFYISRFSSNEWLDKHSPVDAAFYRELQPAWSLQLPFLADDQVVGLFTVSGKTGRRLSKKDIHFLERMGAQMAGAVRMAELLRQTQEARSLAESARRESDALLQRILPVRIAEELKREGQVEPLFYDIVTIIFTDFVGFTTAAEKMRPDELVSQLDGCFSQFDDVVRRNGLEKLKTIGDSYMCAAGVPELSLTHAVDACMAALEFRSFMNQMAQIKRAVGQPHWELRIGIHSGPVTGGVIGKDKFAFDIWGDSVNLASRMESSGEPGKINISGATYALVQDFFECEYRGEIDAKGKGAVPMFFLLRIRPELSADAEGLLPSVAFQEKRQQLLSTLLW